MEETFPIPKEFEANNKEFAYQREEFEGNNKEFAYQRGKFEANNKEFAYQRGKFEANNKEIPYPRRKLEARKELFVLPRERLIDQRELFIKNKTATTKTRRTGRERTLKSKKRRYHEDAGGGASRSFIILAAISRLRVSKDAEKLNLPQRHKDTEKNQYQSLLTPSFWLQNGLIFIVDVHIPTPILKTAHMPHIPTTFRTEKGF